MIAEMLLIKEIERIVIHYDEKEHQIFRCHNLLVTNKHLHLIIINYLNKDKYETY